MRRTGCAVLQNSCRLLTIRGCPSGGLTVCITGLNERVRPSRHIVRLMVAGFEARMLVQFQRGCAPFSHKLAPPFTQEGRAPFAGLLAESREKASDLVYTWRTIFGCRCATRELFFLFWTQRDKQEGPVDDGPTESIVGASLRLANLFLLL